MTIAAINGYQVKSNSGKKTGAKLGALAGTAYIARETKPLRQYIGRNLDKIQVKHPNIHGNFTDIFKSLLKTGKEGKKGLYVCKNSTEIAKRSGILAGVVVAGAIAGATIGSIIDNINNAKTTKKQLNKVG